MCGVKNIIIIDSVINCTSSTNLDFEFGLDRTYIAMVISAAIVSDFIRILRVSKV